MPCLMSQFSLLAVVAVTWFTLPCPLTGLDNGLARTPPMGWMSWQRYRCETDCDLYPYECISEWLFRNATDLLVSEGYAKAGYEYVIIDDCWIAKNRDKDGRLQPDPKRFPSGIKALADYVHSQGLKFGIYEDIGTKTCAGYPGSAGHFEIDTQTFAEWGVDYVKLDGCYTENMNMDEEYPKFGDYLKKTGRPIVYSCSWPAYKKNISEAVWKSIVEHCNLWRPYGDVDDSWGVVLNIMDYFGKNELAKYAGPGHWNDPDMLVIGNFGLSVWEAEVQMAVWAVMAAPLIMSVDLANTRPEFRDILQNPRVIAVDQDPLGIQGKKINTTSDNIEIWSRPISPKHEDHFSYAIAFVSRRTDGIPRPFNSSLKALGLDNPSGYFVHDLFRSSYSGQLLKPESQVKVRIVPNGVVFLQFTALSGEEVKGNLTSEAEVKTPPSVGGANTSFPGAELVFVTLLLIVLQIVF